MICICVLGAGTLNAVTASAYLEGKFSHLFVFLFHEEKTAMDFFEYSNTREVLLYSYTLPSCLTLFSFLYPLQASRNCHMY
jgi:hypothetical protein